MRTACSYHSTSLDLQTAVFGEILPAGGAGPIAGPGPIAGLGPMSRGSTGRSVVKSMGTAVGRGGSEGSMAETCRKQS